MVRYYREYDKRHFTKRLAVALVAMLFLLVSFMFIEKSFVYAAVPSYSKCMVEVESGRVLYDENMNIPLPMASTTKAMTALLAVESGKLAEMVTVQKATTGIEGSSIYLMPGDCISLEALTYGLMLRSGNDAAETIAVFLGGSIENFAKMMNERAIALGLKNTNFVNPHGLHAEKHYTSAYDLAMISAEGMKNADFKQIVSTKTISFDQNGKKWQFVNKNKLLFQYEGGIGVKTGFTKKAGRCLIAASERDGMTVVAVVLNVPPMFEECARLMTMAHSQYKMTCVIKAGEVVCGVPFAKIDYKKAVLTVKNDLLYPLKKDGSEKPEVKITSLAEIPSGFDNDVETGKVEVSFRNKLLFSENLYIMK